MVKVIGILGAHRSDGVTAQLLKAVLKGVLRPNLSTSMTTNYAQIMITNQIQAWTKWKLNC